jgi:hypothetical protein
MQTRMSVVIQAAGRVSLALLASMTVGCGVARLAPSDKPALVPLLAFANWDGEVDVISASGARVARLTPPQEKWRDEQDRHRYTAASVIPGTREIVAVRCVVRWHKDTGYGPERHCAVVRRSIDASADVELIAAQEGAKFASAVCASAEGPCAALQGQDVLLYEPREGRQLQRWAGVLRWGSATPWLEHGSYLRWGPDGRRLYAFLGPDCEARSTELLLAEPSCPNAAMLEPGLPTITRFELPWVLNWSDSNSPPRPIDKPACVPAATCGGVGDEAIRSLFGSDRRPARAPTRLPGGEYCFWFEEGMLFWKSGVACVDPTTEKRRTLEILQRDMLKL